MSPDEMPMRNFSSEALSCLAKQAHLALKRHLQQMLLKQSYPDVQ